MAKKRMFAMNVIDTDLFLDMPSSSQNLYFHLGMRADDDGFVDNPKKIVRIVGCSEDDLKILEAKKFIIPFETGVIVIRHWKLNNYLRKDRYEETIYKNEKSRLTEDESGVYNLTVGMLGIPNDIQRDTIQETICLPSIDKNSIDKNSIDKNTETPQKPKSKYGEYQRVLLTEKEYNKLEQDFDNREELIRFLDEYIERTGYKTKSHYLCIRGWVKRAVKEEKEKDNKQRNNYNNKPSNYYKDSNSQEYENLDRFYV